MSDGWQNRRSRLNHDWLKNRYMVALGKYINLLDDLIEDPDFDKRFLSSGFYEWEAHRSEAFSLPMDFEQEMSPRTLFEKPPLSHCDPSTKEWLGDFVHSWWLHRYSVRRKIEVAMACARNMDIAYSKIRDQLHEMQNATSGDGREHLRDQFANFREKCEDLARAIEGFPNKVLIT